MLDRRQYVQGPKVEKFGEFVPDELTKDQWAEQNGALVAQVPEIARSKLAGSP
jgi:hypothetical protein